MKHIETKLYFSAVIANFIPVILSPINCQREGCLIIFLALGYWFVYFIAYLPYLSISSKLVQSKINSAIVFFVPTIIAPIICFLFNFDLPFIPVELYVIAAVPNLILQFILYAVYQLKKDKKISLTKRFKDWNSN